MKNFSSMLKIVPTVILTTTLMACATPSATLTKDPNKPNQSFFYTLKQQNTPIKVHLSSNKKRYKLDEVMQFHVKSNVIGKVWLLQVDANDEVSVLYPYQPNQNNIIYQNQTMTLLDPSQQNDEFYASSPTGVLSVMAVVAPVHKNLEEIFVINDNRITKVAFDNDTDWGFDRIDLMVKP